MSPQELQGKFTVALRKIGGGTVSADRQSPIVQRSAQMSEQLAIEQAANALSALWKVRRVGKA